MCHSKNSAEFELKKMSQDDMLNKLQQQNGHRQGPIDFFLLFFFFFETHMKCYYYSYVYVRQ